MKFKITVFIIFILYIVACKTEKTNPNYQQDAANPEFLHRSMTSLTSVIKHDLFPPMVAARIYAYAHIAAYEALNAQNNAYKSLVGQVNAFEEMPKAAANKQYCFPLAAVKAYMNIGKTLTFSGDSIDNYTASLLNDFKNIGIPKDVYERSTAFGDSIASAVLKWAAKDMYNTMQSLPKYTVDLRNPARWQPTMPDYADALQPNWNKVRPLVMDSAAQFKPAPPTPFDSTKSSKFYKEAYEVFKTVADSTPERIATGWYWDDNPVAVNNAGHLNFVRKKVSPGGHWLWITMYVCRQKNADIYEASNAYTQVAIGLFEAFISCWDEKYRSELLRPETYIGRYIEPDWSPIIVTPPFPEYTSGHSVISGASSTILAGIFGDKTTFTDSTEVQFGIPPRTFNAFSEAADQAAFSRLYAGIHYRPACINGLTQGQQVGAYVLNKIKTKTAN
jgi:hypothetical protein